MHIPEIRLETDRLILRLPERGDFDAYAQMVGDEETARLVKKSGVDAVIIGNAA